MTRIAGRRVTPGRVEGAALVTRDTISGWGGMDPREGRITERRHELLGQSFAGKVLLFPGAKGSSAWSHYFHLARLSGKAPLALLFTRITTKVALGAVVLRAPAMTDFERDPFDLIETGDHVVVDADAGFIEVVKRNA
jgi:predicted aconitase with swiveling domain